MGQYRVGIQAQSHGESEGCQGFPIVCPLIKIIQWARLRQEEPRFKASLGNVARLCLKIEKGWGYGPVVK